MSIKRLPDGPQTDSKVGGIILLGGHLWHLAFHTWSQWKQMTADDEEERGVPWFGPGRHQWMKVMPPYVYLARGFYFFPFVFRRARLVGTCEIVKESEKSEHHI